MGTSTKAAERRAVVAQFEPIVALVGQGRQSDALRQAEGLNFPRTSSTAPRYQEIAMGVIKVLQASSGNQARKLYGEAGEIFMSVIEKASTDSAGGELARARAARGLVAVRIGEARMASGAAELSDEVNAALGLMHESLQKVQEQVSAPLLYAETTMMHAMAASDMGRVEGRQSEAARILRGLGTQPLTSYHQRAINDLLNEVLGGAEIIDQLSEAVRLSRDEAWLATHLPVVDHLIIGDDGLELSSREIRLDERSIINW